MYLDRSYAKPIRVTNKPLLRHIPHGMAQSCERVPSNTSYHNSAKLSHEGDVRTLNIYPIHCSRVIKTRRWAVVLNT
jgi:hypothetical protein